MKGSDLYTRRLAQIHRGFPGWLLIEPRLEFRDIGDWLRRRRDVIGIADGFVFFPDAKGFIGRGVVSDYQLARSFGIPVWYLDPLQGLIEGSRLIVSDNDREPWDEYEVVGIVQEPR
jgi:hypothetical protein